MLILNQLVGFGVGGVAASIVTYLQDAVLTTDVGTYTFSSQNIGTASDARWIVAGIGWAAGVSRTFTSCTIGGVTATTLVAANDSATEARLVIAKVPTGTTADVVVTLSGAAVRCAISLWHVLSYNDLTTPFHTGSDNTLSGSDVSASLNIPASGYGFGVCYGALASGTAALAWSGLTEVDESTVEVANHVYGSAGLLSTSDASPTVTATLSGGTPNKAFLALASIN